MEPITPTRRRWYQFTLARIFWATAWMALCFALFAAWGWIVFDHWAPVVGLLFVSGLCPFIALGVLFGRPCVGLATGILLSGAYAAANAYHLDSLS